MKTFTFTQWLWMVFKVPSVSVASCHQFLTQNYGQQRIDYWQESNSGKGTSGGHKKYRLTPPTSTFQINITSPTPKFELLVRRKLENKPYTLQQIWKKKREWGLLMLKLVKIAFLLPSGCNTCGDNGNNAKIYCLHPPSEGFWRLRRTIHTFIIETFLVNIKTLK